MARETKAQRLERENTERLAREAEWELSYPKRLLDLFERACKINYELTAKDKKFILTDCDDRYDSFALPLEWTIDVEWVFDRATLSVEQKEREEARRNAEFLARETALRKLTPVERELLGI